MNATVNLFLTGHLLPGFSAETAAPLLAKMMKVPDEQALKCLAGRRTLVKRGLPVADSGKYQQALARMGVETVLEEVPAPFVVPVVAAEAQGFPVINTPSQDTLPSGQGPVVPQTALSMLTVVPSEPTAQSLPVIPELAMVDAPVKRPALTMADLTPVEGATVEAPSIEAAAIEQVTCPACQLVQPKRTLCRQCGTDMPRALLAQQQARADEQGARLQATPGLRQFEKVEEFTPSPFGFWPTGRIGRLRYLAFQVFGYLPIVLGIFVAAFFGAFSEKPTFWVLAIIGIAILMASLLMLRAAALRLHDFGFSGKWLLTPLVALLMLITGSPLAAAITLLGFWVLSILICFWPGDMDDNRYGSPAGDNTVWVYLGCFVCAMLMIVSTVSSVSQAKAAYQDYQRLAYQKEHPEEGEYMPDNELTESESSSPSEEP